MQELWVQPGHHPSVQWYNARENHNVHGCKHQSSLASTNACYHDKWVRKMNQEIPKTQYPSSGRDLGTSHPTRLHPKVGDLLTSHCTSTFFNTWQRMGNQTFNMAQHKDLHSKVWKCCIGFAWFRTKVHSKEGKRPSFVWHQACFLHDFRVFEWETHGGGEGRATQATC